MPQENITKNLGKPIELEEEEEWSLRNTKWLKSIRASKKKYEEKIPITVMKVIEGMLPGEVDLIGHEVSSFTVEGFDEPTETWIVTLKLKGGLDSTEITKSKDLLENSGQVMQGIGPDHIAVYFLLDKSYESRHQCRVPEGYDWNKIYQCSCGRQASMAFHDTWKWVWLTKKQK